MNAQKTRNASRNPNRRKSPPIVLHPLGSILRAKLEALVELGHLGQLEAPPALLSALFALAALHLDGDVQRQAEDLSDWYDEEAQDAEAFTGRYTVTE